MEKKKYHNIEFLRILFALLIVYFHILHSNIMGYVGENEIYHSLAKLCNDAGIIVECFFIMSGYFLYQSYINKPETSVLQFTLKKIFRLLPVLLFSLVICVFFFNHRLEPALFNGLFLQCIGFSLEYKGINWYISPLFWVSIFYFVLLKTTDYKKANFSIAVITYISYVVLVNITFGRETIYGFLCLGVVRALAGIGLGYLIGLVLQELKKVRIVNWGGHSQLQYIVVSIIEIVTLWYLLKWFLFGKSYANSFIVIIIFSILFICFIKGKGLLSQLLDKMIFSAFGRYAYSIYVMQQVAFYILQRTLWRTAIVGNVSLCLFVSLVFCTFVGVLTYHLVEQPCAKLYAKLKFECNE